MTAGFPDCLSFADFRRQFEVLRITPFESGDVDGGDSVFDEREVNTAFIFLGTGVDGILENLFCYITY